MDRTKKLKMNTIMSLMNRITRIISGLILPRFILLYFGSKTNGLVASLNQFLSIITFLDLGVGSVVKAALYRPIAKKDKRQLSLVIAGAKSYFQKIAYVLIAYAGVLIVFYPLLIDSSYGYLSTSLLIFALSISLFGQYYLGIVNELLLNANQEAYIQYASEIVVVILNIIVSILLIKLGAPIEVVKLAAGLVFLLRPVYLSYYVKKNFEIDYDIVPKKDEDPLPQKWSGMGQHIAYTIQNSTDIVVLTLFSTLETVSIFSVHNLVTQAIKMLISSLTTGISSFFGDLLVNDEIDLLNRYFDGIEWIVHTGVIYLYGMAAVLINPFIGIYTAGVEDINYYAPVFSLLLVLANLTYSMRTPYQTLIFSAGHFKQTQISSFIEAGINVIISLFAVYRFGLIGVTVGTLVAMVYRTLYLVVYLSKNLVFRELKKFGKHILVDVLSFGSIFIIGQLASNMYSIESLFDWLMIAAIIGVISLVLLFMINLVFYKETMFTVTRGMFKRM